MTNVRASEIDSCIIGLPDIRAHRLIHRIPSYFNTLDPAYLELNASTDVTTSIVGEATLHLSLLRPGANDPATNVTVCRGASPCTISAGLIAMGYDNTLCSHTPRPREIRDHPPTSEAELLKKSDILDPFEDDDDIEWKHNPFGVDFIEEERELLEQLMSKIIFKGPPQLQTRLKALVREFIDVFV